MAVNSCVYGSVPRAVASGASMRSALATARGTDPARLLVHAIANRSRPEVDSSIGANFVSFFLMFYDARNRLGLRHQIAEHIEQQRLRPVAQRAFGVRMNVNQQSVSAGGHRGAGHRDYGF